MMRGMLTGVLALGVLAMPAQAKDVVADALARSRAAEAAGASGLAITEAEAAVKALDPKSSLGPTARLQLGRLLAADQPDRALPLLDLAQTGLPPGGYDRAEAQGYAALAFCYAKGIAGCLDRMAAASDALAARDLSGENRERAAFLISTAANVAIAGGQRERAAASMARAMALLDAPLDRQGIFAAMAYANAADQATRTSAHDRSIDYTRRAIAITERLRGPAHRDLVDPLSLLGESYLRTGRMAEAGATLTRALEIADVAPDVPVMAHVLALRSLGGFYAQTARPDLAVKLFERAVRLGEADATTSRMMAGVYRDLASIHVATGNYEAARPILLKAVANAAAATGKTSSAYGGALVDLADLDLLRGDLDAAKNEADEARATFAKAIEPTNARNGDPIVIQAKVAFRRNDATAAVALYDQALTAMARRDSSSLALINAKANAALARNAADPSDERAWRIVRDAGDAMTGRLVREARVVGAPGTPNRDQRDLFDGAIDIAWSRSTRKNGAH